MFYKNKKKIIYPGKSFHKNTVAQSDTGELVEKTTEMSKSTRRNSAKYIRIFGLRMANSIGCKKKGVTTV